MLSSERRTMKCKHIGRIMASPAIEPSFNTIHLHHLCTALNQGHQSGDQLSWEQELKGFELSQDDNVICIDLLPRLILKCYNFLNIIHLGGNDTLPIRSSQDVFNIKKMCAV
ncbi:rCG37088 [Rattus norvegicus]|uniref:RCG37088 n=1 Tax=Rattus norvegicus TaxID=10116 RepID=A6HUC3_RAT|nr:rCG37088 [Rattus norvegicus]